MGELLPLAREIGYDFDLEVARAHAWHRIHEPNVAAQRARIGIGVAPLGQRDRRLSASLWTRRRGLAVRSATDSISADMMCMIGLVHAIPAPMLTQACRTPSVQERWVVRARLRSVGEVDA